MGGAFGSLAYDRRAIVDGARAGAFASARCATRRRAACMTSSDGARGRRSSAGVDERRRVRGGAREGDARATTRRGRGFEEGARATGANVDWVRAVFFFAGLGIGLRAFGERGVRGRAKTRARDEGGRRGGEPL